MFGKKETFRKAALERLASPERLDEMMMITLPAGWVALFACGLLLVLAVIWGFLGRIPERVSGEGILIYGGANLPVEASEAGTITEIHVEVGDEVEPGQVLATLHTGAPQQELQNLKQQLTNLELNHEAETEQAALLLKDAELNLSQTQSAAMSNISAQRTAVRIAEDRLARLTRLAAKGAAPGSQVSQAEVELASAQAALNDAMGSPERANLEYAQQKARYESESRLRVREMDELKLQIAQKAKEIAAVSALESPYSGRVIEISYNVGQSVNPRDVMMRLEQTGEGSELVALIYVNRKTGKKVAKGDLAQLALTGTVKKEEDGSMVGIITKKGLLPSSREEMIKDIANAAVVDGIFQRASDAPIRMEAALQIDANSPSGFKWTSGEGPDVVITSQTAFDASIIVDRRRPIDYVLPFLKSLLTG